MEYSKIPVPDGMKSYDISDEHWREYDIVGREIPVSGRATSQNGNVTFEVSSEISIILNNK